MAKTVSEFEWYSKTDLSEYAGKWVVILDNKVVFSGKSLNEPLAKFKKAYPKKKPFIVKIPQSNVLLW